MSRLWLWLSQAGRFHSTWDGIQRVCRSTTQPLAVAQACTRLAVVEAAIACVDHAHCAGGWLIFQRCCADGRSSAPGAWHLGRARRDLRAVPESSFGGSPCFLARTLRPLIVQGQRMLSRAGEVIRGHFEVGYTLYPDGVLGFSWPMMGPHRGGGPRAFRVPARPYPGMMPGITAFGTLSCFFLR